MQLSTSAGHRTCRRHGTITVAEESGNWTDALCEQMPSLYHSACRALPRRQKDINPSSRLLILLRVTRLKQKCNLRRQNQGAQDHIACQYPCCVMLQSAVVFRNASFIGDRCDQKLDISLNSDNGKSVRTPTGLYVSRKPTAKSAAANHPNEPTMRVLYNLAVLIGNAAAIGQTPIVSFDGHDDSLFLADGQNAVSIHVDAAEWPGVFRAANDLALDFGRVTGLNGTVTGPNATISHINTSGHGVIIVGTLGRSATIDRLVRQGRLNISSIQGQWEAFQSAVIRDPVNDVHEALVIVGK
jgi:hypothetical protein